ncbi:hypothetical protein TMatcc_004725 [Talaromyces marneffei ATCC 18224]
MLVFGPRAYMRTMRTCCQLMLLHKPSFPPRLFGMDKYISPVGSRITLRIYITNVQGVDIISVQEYSAHRKLRILLSSNDITRPHRD